MTSSKSWHRSCGKIDRDKVVSSPRSYRRGRIAAVVSQRSHRNGRIATVVSQRSHRVLTWGRIGAGLREYLACVATGHAAARGDRLAIGSSHVSPERGRQERPPRTLARCSDVSFRAV